MQMTLPLDAFGFAVAAAIAFAALDLTQKWSSRYAIATPAGFLCLRLLAGAVLAPLLLLLPTPNQTSPFPWLPFLLLVVVNLLGNFLYLWGVYRADISVVGSLWPLKNFYLPFLVFLLPPHEQFSPLVYGMIVVATVGSLAIAWNGKLRSRALFTPPLLLMLGVTLPVFAISDILLGQVSKAVGGAAATVYTAWGIALLGIPVLLMRADTREAIRASVASRRGITGALLTGFFLVGGTACIGEGFKRAGGSVVLVNVFAMLSGVVLLLVNILNPGWLESEQRRIYLIRFAGIAILVGAAVFLQSPPEWYGNIATTVAVLTIVALSAHYLFRQKSAKA